MRGGKMRYRFAWAVLGRRRRRLILGVAVLAVITGIAMPTASSLQTAVGRASERAGGGPAPIVSMSVRNDTSPPLRDAPPALPDSTAQPEQPLASFGKTVDDLRKPDGLVPKAAMESAVPPPLQSFDGLTNDDNAILLGGLGGVPDPTGEAGPNHYVQQMNHLVGVFSKTGVRAP